MNLNYYNTLIAVADDCPVTVGTVPKARDKKTIAQWQYELLAAHPHVYTQEEVLFLGWLARQENPHPAPEEVARLHEAFFSRSQACMRTSPLAKSHGFGLYFDEAGKVALCPVESPQYAALLADEQVKVVKAMRSRRA